MYGTTISTMNHVVRIRCVVLYFLFFISIFSILLLPTESVKSVFPGAAADTVKHKCYILSSYNAATIEQNAAKTFLNLSFFIIA